MSREVVPLKGPDLMYAIQRTLLPNLRRRFSAQLIQLPLKFLARTVSAGKGFVEIVVPSTQK